MSDVGSAAASAANEPRLMPPAADDRTASAAAWMAAKRSVTSISLVGTRSLARVKAFEPALDSLRRVLMAIDARSVSTGAPSSRW